MLTRFVIISLSFLVVPAGTAFAEKATTVQVAQVVLDRMPTTPRRPVVPRTRAADPSVARMLRQLGYRYQIKASGTYELRFKTTGKRHQVVRIESKVQVYGSYRARHICSFGIKTQGPPSAAIAYQLLKQNGDSKVGHWGIFKTGNFWLADFCAKMETGQGPQILKTYMLAVLNTADQMERKLTRGDRY